ncbi:hypothetical protein DW852_06635 [Bifidobacterium pseudocatenulatum]|uniref:acyltransferase family protein n=1 Tax=Bifidobacterium pseudocatenulatum TaxID=28026 RepID=UPI000E5169F3|nr:hypothetical protein DW852_06635 [Bifidobacterium pseudocatenulatum]RHC35226.1 hypothetical protein DW847_06615 [Bifidobacterium pseudocatenulatum]
MHSQNKHHFRTFEKNVCPPVVRRYGSSNRNLHGRVHPCFGKTRPIAWTLFDNILVPLFTTIGRIGVPVFLILTGFLVLPRLNKSGVRRFYRRNFLPLAVSFEIWNLAVFIVRRFIASDNSLTFRQYVLASLLIGKEIDVPLWYIDSFFLCISFYRS